MAAPRVLKSGSNGLFWAFENAKDVQTYSDPQDFPKGNMNDTEGAFSQGVTTYEQLQKKMNEAWVEGMEIMFAFVEKLQATEIPEIKSCKRVTRYTQEETDDVDFDKMMAGDAAFYRKTSREQTGGPPTVTIFIDTTTPYTMDASDVLWRGAAAIALAKKLEEKGYQTEMWVVNGSKLFANDPMRVMTACCLKRPSDPIDVSTLVNIVSGWCYRTLIFNLLYTICRKSNKSVEYGLGSCVTPTQADLDLLSQDGNRCYSAGAFSFSAALNIIESEMQKIAEKTEAGEAFTND